MPKPRPDHRHRCSRAIERGRAAFTLIELLIVLLIAMLIMSIAVAAWMGLFEPNAETATRSLLSDMVRQARQQSLSTGRPVVLTIETDGMGNATIAGLSQSMVWSEDFEWNEPTAITAKVDAADGDYNVDVVPGELYMGTTGYGWRSFVGAKLQPQSTTRPLIRSVDDGFYLECSVRPQAIQQALNDDGETAVVIPLVLVTPSGQTTDSVTGAVAGIELWRQPLFMLLPTTDDTTDPPTCRVSWEYGKQDHWMLMGWVGERPDPVEHTQPSDFDDARGFVGDPADAPFSFPAWRQSWISFGNQDFFVRDFSAMDAKGENNAAAINFNPHSDAGGRWQRVGLLYDGKTLKLLRGGQEVDGITLPEASLTAVRDILAAGPGDGGILDDNVSVWIGRHTADGRSRTAPADFDRCMLSRIGGQEAVRLPQGVTTRTVADPDDASLTVHQRYLITVNHGVVDISAFPAGDNDAGDQLHLHRGSDDTILQFAVQPSGSVVLQSTEDP